MNNYTAVYKLYKEAGFWDDAGNKIKQAWDSYNDFADKNQWVRPAIYGLGGAAVGAAPGILMKNPVLSVLLGLLGGGVGATAGALSNPTKLGDLNLVDRRNAQLAKLKAAKNKLTPQQIAAGQAKKLKALSNPIPQNIDQIPGQHVNTSSYVASGGIAALSLLAALIAKKPGAVKNAWGSVKNAYKAAPLIGALNFGKMKAPAVPTLTPNRSQYNVLNWMINPKQVQKFTNMAPGWQRTLKWSGGVVNPAHF